jgi:glycosyltransferase involved in cell wall biosynthesis
VITQAGSLIHRKGHDVLLQAFAKLRRLRPQCHLLIVGDGPDRAAIEQFSRELQLDSAVHFLGFIPGPPGVVFRDATDVTVSPSRAEGFGLTVIEAGAAGCPVVATETTGMTEIITNEESGLIVPIEDPPRLMDALLRLVDDPALRKRMGAALQRRVQERFLVSSYVRNLESAYEQLLAIPKTALGWRGSAWKGQFGMYRRWTAQVLGRRLARLIRPNAG